MKNYIAQVSHPIGPLSPGNVGLRGSPVSTITNLLSTVIGLMTVIAIIYFVFMLITGAIAIITSAGDQGKYEDARRRITTGAIGLVVVIAALFIVGLIGILLDIPYILDFGQMINYIRLP